MGAMNFHDDLPSIPIHNFMDHYVLVFDLTSMQDATEHCHNPELTGEPLRLELNFNEALKSVKKSLYWINECRRLQSTSLALSVKIPNIDDVALHRIFIVFLSSSIGTSAHFLVIVSLICQIIHLPLSILNQITCLASTG